MTHPKKIARATDPWTDVVFALYIEGSLGPLSAAEVCESIDWISGRSDCLERIARISRREPGRLRAQLIAFVETWARHRGRASAPTKSVAGGCSRSV
jgi:hypothetical protein